MINISLNFYDFMDDRLILIHITLFNKLIRFHGEINVYTFWRNFILYSFLPFSFNARNNLRCSYLLFQSN